MKDTNNPHTLTDHVLTCKARLTTDVYPALEPETRFVLGELLRENRLRPHDLSKALKVPNQTIHQLLHKPDLYPKISTLWPVAKYFKITISQLIGEVSLDMKEKTVNELKDEPGVWDYDLFAQCTECAAQLFAKYKITPNPKFAATLICDIYQYSLRNKDSTLDESFADWYISQHANKK
jgi:hypothetical protein